MKINMPENWKIWMTVQDVQDCKALKKGLETDGEMKNFDNEADMLCQFVAGHKLNVLAVNAEFCKNSRIMYGYYGNGIASTVDVWIEVMAIAEYDCFYQIGACLSDIWQIGPSETEDYLKSHMTILKYKYVK